MNTTKTAMAKRYELAFLKLLSTQPTWKQNEIRSMASASIVSDRLYDDFVQQVATLAESEGEIFLTE